jgi:hypothetical protein
LVKEGWLDERIITVEIPNEFDDLDEKLSWNSLILENSNVDEAISKL